MNESSVRATSAAGEQRLTFEEIVRAGPGTLSGGYLRSFWQPVYHCVDIAPGEAKPLRLMNEGFTLYRGASGTPHLVARSCPPSRAAWLSPATSGSATRPRLRP